MPTVSPSPWGPKPFFALSSGLPAVGYKLFAYLAGSVGTKQDTYTDSTGTTANTNPVVLDVNGTPPDEWWFASGSVYKIIFAPAADTDPPTSPIWTVDNVRGIGDATITPSEWVASSLVPTFISATSFSLVGDQTATFQVGRRLKSTNTSGTVYSTIATSVFSTVTTVTVVNDASALDSGLVAVSYGIISVTNTSDPFQGTASTGDVNGPASALDGHLVQFDGTTGKLLKDGIALDTDGTLAANSDARVSSQKAVKTYVTASIAASGSGDVVGPASSTDGHFATYDGATGKLLKDTLALDTDTTLAANSDTRVASQKAVKAYVTASAGGAVTSITGTTGATGGNATVTGGTSTTSANAGGVAVIVGGTPGATGVGGAVTITGAAGGATSGNGGQVSITGGAGTSAASSVGGVVSLVGGASPSASQAGGTANVTGGSGSVGGNVVINSGAGSSGSSGSITIQPGTTASGVDAGTINILGRQAPGAATGSPINMTGGSGGVTSGSGGPVAIAAGVGVGAFGDGGALSLSSGTGATHASLAGNGGALTLTAGAGGGGSFGTGGAMQIRGGSASGTATSGSVNIRPGAPGAVSGNIQLDGGRGAALGTTATGGFVTIPTCAGTPTGVPANVPTGSVAMVVDTTASKFWLYIGGTWKGVVVA